MKTCPPRHTHTENSGLSGNRAAPEFSPSAHYSPSETHILRGPSQTEVGVHTESYPWRNIAPRKDAPSLTTPGIITDQHTLKNIITKTHTYRRMPTKMGTRSEHPRNPGPGNECANRWPRPERKLPALGRVGPRGAQGHTAFPRRPRHAVIDMSAHHSMQATPRATCHFRENFSPQTRGHTAVSKTLLPETDRYPNTRRGWLPDAVEAVCFCLPAPVSRRDLCPPPTTTKRLTK